MLMGSMVWPPPGFDSTPLVACLSCWKGVATDISSRPDARRCMVLNPWFLTLVTLPVEDKQTMPVASTTQRGGGLTEVRFRKVPQPSVGKEQRGLTFPARTRRRVALPSPQSS